MIQFDIQKIVFQSADSNICLKVFIATAEKMPEDETLNNKFWALILMAE